MKYLFILAFLPCRFLMAQTGTWTLEQCIEHALKNNPDIQLAKINEQLAENNYLQSKLNLTPDANITGGQFFQSGRSIDRFTNQFVQTTVKSNNFQFSSSMLLYSGGQVRNTITQNKFLWLASEYDMQNMEQSIALNVSNLFLQTMQAKELTAAAEQTLLSTKLQLERTEKLFLAGSVNEGQLLNLKSQLANDELTLVNNKNQEISALTNLKMALRLPAADPFDIIKPTFANPVIEEYNASFEQVIDSASSRRPELKAANSRIRAAEYSVRSARGALLPTLSVGGNLSTVYSSNAKTITSTTISGFQPIGRVQGSNEVVEAPDINYTLQTIDFTKQLKDNFGQSLGVNLNIPIYNQFQTRYSIKRTLLETERARMNVEKAKISLYNEVTSAWNAFTSASARLAAAVKNAEAQQLNLSFVQKRFDAGLAGIIDLQMARTLESSARLNLASVKYEYIFRKMVLDFYMGKELKF